MKLRLLPVSAIATALLAAPLWAETAEIDFGSFTPPAKGGQFIEVNLKGNLLGMAARVADKEEPEAAALLKSIQSINVHVIGLDDGNRASTQQRITEIRGQLEAKGWEKNVTVKEEQSDIAVYTKLHGQESVEGIVVTIFEEKQQAVVVNIVGDIRPEKLISVGERFDIEPLKKLHDKLGGRTDRKKSPSVTEAEPQK